MATLHRRLGNRDEAITWGKLAQQHAADGLSSSTGREEDDWRTLRRLALDLLGNCHFDRGSYQASFLYHSQALLVALRLPPRQYNVIDIFRAVLGMAPATWDVVHTLGNFGNSLRELKWTTLYRQSRVVALLTAARLDGLDALARMPDKAFTLRLISRQFADDIPLNDPLGAALARVRAALGEVGTERG